MAYDALRLRNVIQLVGLLCALLQLCFKSLPVLNAICPLCSIPRGPHRYGLTPSARNPHRFGHQAGSQLDRGLRGALSSFIPPVLPRLSLHIARGRSGNPLATRASFLDRLARGHRHLMAGLDLVCTPTLLRVRVCTCNLPTPVSY